MAEFRTGKVEEGDDLVRSNKVTALERVYDYLADNPSATNRDVADGLDINYDVV